MGTTRSNTIIGGPGTEVEVDGEFGDISLRPQRVGAAAGGGTRAGGGQNPRRKRITGIDGVFSGLGGQRDELDATAKKIQGERKERRDRLAQQAAARRRKKRLEQEKPEMFIDVNMPSGTLRHIAVRKGDKPEDLAAEFAAECANDGEATLTAAHVGKLTDLITSRIAEFKAAVAEREAASKEQARRQERRKWRGKTTMPQPFSFSASAASAGTRTAVSSSSSNGGGGSSTMKAGAPRGGFQQQQQRDDRNIIGRLHVELTADTQGTIVIREGDDARVLVARFKRDYPDNRLQAAQLGQIERRIQERLDGYANACNEALVYQAAVGANGGGGGGANGADADGAGELSGWATRNGGGDDPWPAEGDGDAEQSELTDPPAWQLTEGQKLLWERTLAGALPGGGGGGGGGGSGAGGDGGAGGGEGGEGGERAADGAVRNAVAIVLPGCLASRLADCLASASIRAARAASSCAFAARSRLSCSAAAADASAQALM